MKKKPQLRASFVLRREILRARRMEIALPIRDGWMNGRMIPIHITATSLRSVNFGGRGGGMG